MITSVLIFIIFMAVKIKTLSSQGDGFLVKNSSGVMFLSVLFLTISIFLKFFSEHRVIESTVNSLLHDNVLVEINGRLAGSDFLKAFGRAMGDAIKFKEKGSHPKNRNEIKLYIDGYFFMSYLLRQDSRDLNMYWISASCSNKSIDLGYIKLESGFLNMTNNLR